MPRVKEVLVSHCGLICEYCKAYLKKLCLGCDHHVDECQYAKCVLERGVKACTSCEDFPCNLHVNGFTWETSEYGKLKWRVFSRVYMEIISRCAES